MHHTQLLGGVLFVPPFTVYDAKTCKHVHKCCREQKGLCSFAVKQQTGEASNTRQLFLLEVKH